MGVQPGQKNANAANGGHLTLEQMNLDRGDEQPNFDPFYNPITGFGANNQTDLELQAQNQYMGKETTHKQEIWQPNNQQQNQQ